MNMPFDEDALRELELWPYLALQRPAVASVDAAPDVAASAVTAAETPHQATPRAAADRRGNTARSAAPVSAPTPVVVSDPARAARIAALDWDGLQAEAANCQACGLCRQRKQAVLGVGARAAPWLLVGEGPGAEEDEQGEPFVGQAGKLLDAMLAATGLQRGREVYIANVVKCRPPGNRTPSPEEALACAPLLDRQIELVRPKLVVALGKTAVNRLTGSDASMASLRGRLHEYRGIPVVATYHPAYLLRNLPDKLKGWEDMMLAKKTMAGL